MTQPAYRKYRRASDVPARLPSFIRVSDHALLRWLERVKSIDIELLRQEFRDDTGLQAIDSRIVDWLGQSHGIDMEFFRRHLYEICKHAACVGATRLKMPECDFVLLNGTVITVIA